MALRRKTPLRANAKPKSKFEISEIKTPKRRASRATLMSNADNAFSLFIRTRDAQIYKGKYIKCISCGRVIPIDQADNGHYVNRRHMSLRFNELNCNAQCRQCNRFDEGNIQGYRRGLIDKIGESKVEMLEAAKNIYNKLDSFELENLAKHYKAETKKFEYQIK